MGNTKLGLVGLGHMGGNMAGSYLAAGFEGSVAAADLSLSEVDLEQTDRIMADFVPVSGSSPENDARLSPARATILN